MTLLHPDHRVVFAQGAAVLLVAITLHCLEKTVFTTGDTYALLFGQFASKREVAVVSILFLFGGTYAAGLAQGWIVDILTQPGHFEAGVGLGLWAIIIFTNQQVESWKPLNEDDPVFWVIAIIGFVLIASSLA